MYYENNLEFCSDGVYTHKKKPPQIKKENIFFQAFLLSSRTVGIM